MLGVYTPPVAPEVQEPTDLVKSNLENEPVGAIKIPNMVAISQANYDQAVIDETIVEDTIYTIIE